MVKTSHFNSERFHEYRGRELEADWFGELRDDTQEYRSEIEKLNRQYGKPYAPFKQAVEIAKRFQKDDPTNPSREYSRDLRLAILEKLGFEGEDMDRVKIFSARKTPLDIFHGVDGFVEIDNPDVGEIDISIDVTKRPDKLQDGGKADVLVTDLPDPQTETEAYLQKIDEIAEEIIRKVGLMRERRAA